MSKSLEKNFSVPIDSAVIRDYYVIILRDLNTNNTKVLKIGGKEYLEYFIRDVNGELKATHSLISEIPKIFPNLENEEVKVKIFCGPI